MPRSMWRRARCRRDGPPAISTPSSAGASRPGAAIRTCPTSSTAGIRSSSRNPANPQPQRNWQRWSSPALDKIIEDIRTVGFDDPKSIELGKDYVKLAVKEMPTIPLMAYNVFTAMDQTYWTGFPTSENPYTNPVPNWGNSALHVRQAEAGQLGRDEEVAMAYLADSRMRLSELLGPACLGAHERISRLYRRRLAQFVLVVFIGINLAYVITHATPIDPVEQSISAVTSFGNTASGCDRADAHIAARALRPRRHAARAISGVLEADPARRFRTVDVGVSNSGLDPDRPCAALDRRTARDLDHRRLGARKPAGRTCRLLPEQPRTEADGRDRHGAAPDPLLHSGAAAADRFRLPLAGASDHRRFDDEPAAGLDFRLHRQRAAARHPAGALADPDRASGAGSSACARWSPMS